MHRRNILLGAMLLLLSLGSQAAQIDIRTNFVPESAREQLPLRLLELALSYDTQNTYNIIQHPESVNQERLRQMLSDGEFDLMWVGTRPELEKSFIPIRVPLFKGLLGHRIFIIRNGDQARFSQARNFNDLLELQAGQGRFWGDTPILESAGINVVKPVKYPSLFHMLDGQRFDYFPRGLHEPWGELDSFEQLSLAVEQELMLVYPMPLYFFTNNNNPQLAKTIYDGLIRGTDEGKFDEIFLNNEAIKDAIERSNIKSRRVFRISNPALSPETPIDNEKLWFDVEASS